jgi:hypothetical protein
MFSPNFNGQYYETWSLENASKLCRHSAGPERAARPSGPYLHKVTYPRRFSVNEQNLVDGDLGLGSTTTLQDYEPQGLQY